MSENKNILLILIIAIVVAVSASFFNNYFAYYFFSQDRHATIKTGRKDLSKLEKPNAIKIKESWNWQYSEIGIEDDNYPIVVLRDGYKAIKIAGDKVLMGWQYEALNTSNIKSYIVSIDYKLVDNDGFIINESSSANNVKPYKIINIKQTTLVSCDDYNKITGALWSIKLIPNWNIEKLESNRFKRAGAILKKESPYWLKTYLTYLFMNDFPSKGQDKGFFQIIYPHKYILAQALDIKPEPILKDIGKKLNLDFTKYNLPPWQEIVSNPNYASLEKGEKDILKKFLGSQSEFGNYSPQTGRKGGDWEIYDEFPEPTKPVNKTK
jgi:hypothetical protein